MLDPLATGKPLTPPMENPPVKILKSEAQLSVRTH